MIALREHPAVAARDDGELDHRRPLEVARASASSGTFPSSATPRTIPSPRPGRAGHDAVRTVRPDEHVGPHRVAADPRRDAGVVGVELLDANAVAELRARRGRLLQRGTRRAGGAGSSGSAARRGLRRSVDP